MLGGIDALTLAECPSIASRHARAMTDELETEIWCTLPRLITGVVLPGRKCPNGRIR